jgi:xanthine dehydrogenase small subunit
LFNISFYLNGKEINASVSYNSTALSFLRNDLGLTGTKEGCSEGDCGACTIVLGKVKNGIVKYSSVNSCLIPAVRLHGKHVITIEGIDSPKNLHPIQKAILDFHGLQCGYCTPGIIMSLFALFINRPRPPVEEIIDSIQGNLCRCTGYEPIKRAAVYLSRHNANLVPDYFNKVNSLILSFDKKINSDQHPSDHSHKYFIPSNLKELFKIIDKSNNQNIKILNGGTDVMVDVNIKKIEYQQIVDISDIKELNFIDEKKGAVVIGAGTPYSDIYENKIISKKLPMLCSTISNLGSQQIRNTATIAGNIGNASPVADVATALIAFDAKLILMSKSRQRTVNITKFYVNYKKTMLKNNEIIFAVEIPIKNTLTSFEKSAKRKAVDIASVNSAISLELNNSTIHNARIAFGGVAPYPLLALKTSRFLKGKLITRKLVEQVTTIAASEIKPISDLRGSKEFRTILVRNQIIRHFFNLFPDLYAKD